MFALMESGLIAETTDELASVLGHTPRTFEEYVVRAAAMRLLGRAMNRQPLPLFLGAQPTSLCAPVTHTGDVTPRSTAPDPHPATEVRT